MSDPVIGSVRVENPAYPVGYELEVPGLGLVKNYEEREVTQTQQMVFQSMYSQEWPESGVLLIIQGESPESPEEPEPESDDAPSSDTETTGGGD